MRSTLQNPWRRWQHFSGLHCDCGCSATSFASAPLFQLTNSIDVHNLFEYYASALLLTSSHTIVGTIDTCHLDGHGRRGRGWVWIQWSRSKVSLHAGHQHDVGNLGYWHHRESMDDWWIVAIECLIRECGLSSALSQCPADNTTFTNGYFKRSFTIHFDLFADAIWIPLLSSLTNEFQPLQRHNFWEVKSVCQFTASFWCFPKGKLFLSL